MESFKKGNKIENIFKIKNVEVIIRKTFKAFFLVQRQALWAD
jgi:hypothetical protein